MGVPAQLAAKEVYQIFSLAYAALQVADPKDIPSVPGEIVQHHMDILGRTELEEKASINRRLTAMCISDLARGLRQSLEDAATYIDMLETPANAFRDGIKEQSEHAMVSSIEAAVLAHQQVVRQRAQAMRHPQLVAKVVKGLKAPLSWTPELTSFQKVRNCLEHRGGIVGLQDLDETNLLTLRLPYLKVDIVGQSGIVRPFELGMALQEPSQMQFEVAVRTRTFRLGEVVEVEPKQIGEMAFACWLFAADIVDKLTPRPPSASTVRIHV